MKGPVWFELLVIRNWNLVQFHLARHFAKEWLPASTIGKRLDTPATKHPLGGKIFFTRKRKLDIMHRFVDRSLPVCRSAPDGDHDFHVPSIPPTILFADLRHSQAPFIKLVKGSEQANQEVNQACSVRLRVFAGPRFPPFLFNTRL
jgi:hypothetical protein